MNKLCYMLDSGAFSAWSLKKQINVEKYIAFLKKWKDYVEYYINLDIIPAEFGCIPTKQEVEESAKKSWETLKYIESHGLTPIPVFHQDEDFKWLALLIKEKYNYICISPANDRTTKEKIHWLDTVFDFICDTEGKPLVKTHSMGATSVHILFRFPWFSADSTTWSRAGRYGDIFIPQIGENGEFIYNKSPMIVGVCKEERNIKRHSNHFYSLPKQVKEKMETYITNKGYTLEGLSNEWTKRDELNLLYWMDVERYANIEKFDRTLMMKGMFDKENWE